MLVQCVTLLLMVVEVTSFAPCSPFQIKSSSAIMMNDNSNKLSSQHELIRKSLVSGFLSLSLLYGPVLPEINKNNQIANNNNILSVQPAFADFRAAQKRTYFRFVPKLEEGRDFYKNELKSAIDGEKWDVVSKFFETYVSKYNPNDPSQVDATDSYVNVHLYRPMQVFSGTFAERGTSTKQRALLEQLDLLKSAMGDLERCVKDRKGEGLFAADIKMPTGAARKTQALTAWNKGKDAINNYITTANDGLMLELNKLKTI